MARLIDVGRYDAEVVCSAGDLLQDIDKCSLWNTPQIALGTGGQDKPDKPTEKRPTTNMSEPQ